MLRRALSRIKLMPTTVSSGLVKKYLPEVHYKRKIIKEITRIRNSRKSYSLDNVSKNPGNIVLEINNTCNLNCLMCSTQKSRRKKGEMSIDLFEHLVKETQKSGMGRQSLVVHTVGEPLYYSKLPELFKICNKYDVRLHFTSNGLLLHKHLDLFKEYPGVVRSIAFSVDGASKNTYEKIRVGGKYERLIENLGMITDYNSGRPKDRKIDLSLQAVISKDNVDEVPMFFAAYEKYFPRDKIIFNFLCNSYALHSEGAYYQSQNLFADRLQTVNAPCKLLWLQTHVLFNGEVSACCRDYNGEMIIGNILKDSFADIWNNELYRDYRKRHFTRNVEKLTYCRDCYQVKHEVVIILNNYFHYLFEQYRNYPREFYQSRISRVIQYLNDNYTDDGITSYGDLSFLK